MGAMSSIQKAMLDMRRLPASVVAAKISNRVKRMATGRYQRWLAERGALGISDQALERVIGRSRSGKGAWLALARKELCRASLLRIPPNAVAGEVPRVDALRSAAGKAMGHVFDLLGSGDVHVHLRMRANGRAGRRYDMSATESEIQERKSRLARFVPGEWAYEPIDWHVDFISGYRWPRGAWHADMAVGNAVGADIKVPWELARCYHLPTLAKCFLLDRDERHAREIVAQVLDFIESNPVGRGPNWMTPMEVAIRLSNWMVALAAIADSAALTDQRLWLILRSIHDHARFVERNLEWSAEVNGNHYTSNLAGLYLVGAFCPRLPRAARWRAFARPLLEQEIFRQVYDDGCNFEGSTFYHRLVLEMFFYAAVAAARVGEPFSARYQDRLCRMADVIRLVSLHSGQLAQIGDNDSGRFLVLDSLPPDSPRADQLLPAIDLFLDSGTPVCLSTADWSAAWWLGLKAASATPASVAGWRARGSAVFPVAGWAMLRGAIWECLVSCGPNGQNGNGGHGHNDKLAINVAFDGMPIVVDPGTYLYTADPAARNRFRSTAYHSTPQLAGVEQNAIPSQLFSLPDCSRARIEGFSPHALQASHGAFGEAVSMDLRLAETGPSVRYSVGAGDYVMRWHLAPGIVAGPSVDGAQLETPFGSFRLSTSAGACQVDRYDYSSGYGRIEQAVLLELRFQSKLSWQLVLQPRATGGEG